MAAEAKEEGEKMATWYVTEADEGDPMTWSGDAIDAEDAGDSAVVHWYEHGAWAGETVPDKVDVYVYQDGRRVTVRVRIDWTISTTTMVVPATPAPAEGE